VKEKVRVKVRVKVGVSEGESEGEGGRRKAEKPKPEAGGAFWEAMFPRAVGVPGLKASGPKLNAEVSSFASSRLRVRPTKAIAASTTLIACRIQ
jgi:hypothetical protein